MSNDDRLRVQSLAAEIAQMSEENFAAHRRDISVAAKTIMECADPSGGEETVGLVLRMAPHVPQADRLELPDGKLVEGVKGIEVKDIHGEQRVAIITIKGIAILGQPTLLRS